ncbi:MAG: alpha/beta hydrolase [Promethearchaeota archaeon]|nr:MAG: alpha/beta hydrolase [Candidatus Lokiarchaeota archaeon]
MNLKKIIRLLILISGYLLLGFGLYSGTLLITGGIFSVAETLLVCALPFIAMYSFFVYPIIGIAMNRLHRRNKKIRFVPLIIGGIILIFNILPFVGISTTIAQGNTQFQAVFGPDYINHIPENLTAKFKTQPFDLWQMYNNYESYECNVTYNCGPYLTVPGVNDEFYFDYYSPKTGDGPFPTIINIHGGAWVIGNKGLENRPTASRYLAHQGYCVFDIQHGLGRFPEDPLIDNTLGWVQSLLGRDLLNKSYTITEMAIQIMGNFTDYLVAHADLYKVDTNRIYVTGNSAGAHLAGLFLGYNSTYKSIFNDTLQLKGLILFYCPANLTHLYNYHAADPLAHLFNIDIGYFFSQVAGGTPQENATLFENLSPVFLADSSAPPVLILHGQIDNMVPFIEAKQLHEKLLSVGRPSIFLSFPHQGHAFDYFFNSPGGQVSMFFIERFLAATQYIEV